MEITTNGTYTNPGPILATVTISAEQTEIFKNVFVGMRFVGKLFEELAANIERRRGIKLSATIFPCTMLNGTSFRCKDALKLEISPCEIILESCARRTKENEWQDAVSELTDGLREALGLPVLHISFVTGYHYVSDKSVGNWNCELGKWAENNTLDES